MATEIYAPAELPSIAEFSDHCRFWRRERGYSQLNLAIKADISQKHLSWLETGRSQPSREMVVKLAKTMDLPLRSRNAMLCAAGFSSLYSEHSLEAPEMSLVMQAVDDVLSHHDPFPAVVLDRFWHIKRANQGALKLLDLMGDQEKIWRDIEDNGNRSLARLTLHQKGLRPMIGNFQAIAEMFKERIYRELSHARDSKLSAELSDLLRLIEDLPNKEKKPLLPVLPIEFEFHNKTLKLFSVFTSFGTPMDVTTEELRIESFYPSDSDTRLFFSSQQSDN